MPRPAGTPRARFALRTVLAALFALAPLQGVCAQAKPAGRILGVFDDATGQPLAGAEVIDLATGTRTVTSVAGMATIAWLAPGTTLLQVRKVGFASRMLTVSTSATDTVSITVVLTPLTQTLPAVVTKARAPGDTVRTLQLSGFYERRNTTGAPASAFVTAAQIEKWHVMYLGDVKKHTGRGLCGDIFVNGSRVPGGVWLGPGDNGPGLRIEAADIAGIEIYSVSETPSAFGGTKPSRSGGGRGFTFEANRCSTTLIWLK